MKKLLLASTALLMTAGAAAADVKVGGNGRMGLHFDGDDWNFTSRIRVVFTLSGQTDNGLSFGGTIRADNAAAGATGNAGNIFISGAFGKLSMGDVDGAAEKAAGNVSGVGLTGLGDKNDTFYYADFVGESANDPQALYEYTMGGFGLFLSAKDGNGATNGGRGIGVHNPTGFWRTYGVGVSYSGTFSGGSFRVGLGFEHLESILTNANGTNIVFGGQATFGDTTLKAMIGQEEFGIFEMTQFGLSVDHKFGATTVTAFWRQNDYNLGGGTDRWLGLGVAHSLGGGATLKAGIVSEEIRFGGVTTDDLWGDIGIDLTF